MRLPTLKKSSQFSQIRNKGNYFKSSSFNGYILHDADLENFLVGIIASKKLGNAVERNRAKRRLKELINKNTIQRFNFGMDYVLIARKASLDRDFQDLQQDLNSAINFFQTKQNL